MSDAVRCHCQRCTVRGLMGPAILITIGVLFLLHQLHGGYFDFTNTWPVILVVIGMVQLASAFAPRDGHVETPPISAVPGAPPPPPAVPPPPASSAERQ